MSPSATETEVLGQPEALERFLGSQRPRLREIAPRLLGGDVRYVVVVARGTSDNAARYGQYVLGIYNRLVVALAAPSILTLYDAVPRLDGALVMAVSQSGASPDVTAVLEEGRRQGRPTIAFTNEPESPAARAAEHVVELHAGLEQGVAATKTYMNSLAGLALLSATAVDDERRLGELEDVPRRVAEQCELARGIDMTVYAGVASGTVVARGVTYGTAFEIALKLRELSGIPFEPYSAADIMHGPIGAVHANQLTVLVAPRGPGLDDMRKIAENVRVRGGALAILTDVPEFLQEADLPLPLVEGCPQWLTPLVAVVPGQFMGIRLAEARDIDPDRPNKLTKVTLTR